MIGSLAACSEAWTPSNERNGQLALNSLSIAVNSSEKLTGTDATMKQASRDEYDLSDFVIRVYDASDAMVANWRYADMPEIFTLPVGKNYRVDVLSHQVKKADWDAPLFVGSKNFDIVDSEITDIGQVVCSFASLKVTVEFSDALKKAMADDAKVRIVANDLGELEFTATEARAGYFEVVTGSNTLAYYFEGEVNGNYEEFHNVYTDIEAGQHRIFKFKLKSNDTEPDIETGTVTPGSSINVDVDVTDENINGTVTPGEDPENPERPGGEVFEPTEPTNPTEPTDPENPGDITKGELTITAEQMLFDTPMNPDDYTNGKVNIYAEKGIQNLYVKIVPTDYFKGLLDDVAVPLEFDVANPTAADESVLELLGNPDVKGKTEAQFDISQFLELIPLGGSGQQKFVLTVVDQGEGAAQNSDSKTLIFEVK